VSNSNSNTNSVCTITPVRNGEAFIADAVHSLVACPQVRRAYVVDDDSQDGTLDVLRDLKKEFEDRIVVAQLPHHENQFMAANLGLGLIGRHDPDVPWIGFLDADDKSYPNRFNKQLEVASDDSTAKRPVVAVGGGCRNVGPDGIAREGDTETGAQNMEYDPLDMALRSCLNLQWTATSIYRQEVFHELGGFAYSTTHGDSEFFVRLAWMAKLKGWSLRNVTDPVILRRTQIETQVSLNEASSRSLKRHAYERLLREHHAYYKYMTAKRQLEPGMLRLPNPYSAEAGLDLHKIERL
jgi:glycosyltransferase involved in cell wall biosynthesis